MTIKKYIFTLILFSSTTIVSEGQTYNQSCKNVLHFKRKGIVYSFNTKDTKYSVKLLGSLIAGNTKYYILTIKSSWGKNQHTNGYIWVYNTEQQYVGRYILGDALDLPYKIVKNKLLFSNKGKGCKKNHYSEINFNYGLPQKIFILACGEMGDIYEFTK
jgi:hypothetical protein